MWGSALVVLWTLGFTVDAWGLSTLLVGGGEQGRLIPVPLGASVSLEGVGDNGDTGDFKGRPEPL